MKCFPLKRKSGQTDIDHVSYDELKGKLSNGKKLQAGSKSFQNATSEGSPGSGYVGIQRD